MSKPMAFEWTSACGYLPGKTAAFIMHEAPATLNSAPPERQEQIRAKKFNDLSKGLSAQGIYSMALSCKLCRACVPIRINTNKAKLSKSQKRVLNKNKALKMSFTAPTYQPEHYALYKHYIQARHPESDMTKYSAEDVKDIINRASQLTLIHDADNKLLALVALDTHENALSMEHLFYNPDESQTRSLGTYAWLRLIELAKEAKIEHIYPGSWVKDSPKLNYKKRFPGLETIVDGEWIDFSPELHTQGPDLTALVFAELKT